LIQTKLKIKKENIEHILYHTCTVIDNSTNKQTDNAHTTHVFISAINDTGVNTAVSSTL